MANTAQQTLTMTPRQKQAYERLRGKLEAWVAVKKVSFVPGVLTEREMVQESFETFCNGGEPIYGTKSNQASPERFWAVLQDIVGPLTGHWYHGESSFQYECVQLQIDDVVSHQDLESIPLFEQFDPSDFKGTSVGDLIDFMARKMYSENIAIDMHGRVYRFTGEKWATTTNDSMRGAIEALWKEISVQVLPEDLYRTIIVRLVYPLSSQYSDGGIRLFYVNNAVLILHRFPGAMWIKAYTAQRINKLALWKNIDIDWADVKEDRTYLPAVERGMAQQTDSILEKLFRHDSSIGVNVATQAEYVDAAHQEFIRRRIAHEEELFRSIARQADLTESKQDGGRLRL